MTASFSKSSFESRGLRIEFECASVRFIGKGRTQESPIGSMPRNFLRQRPNRMSTQPQGMLLKRFGTSGSAKSASNGIPLAGCTTIGFAGDALRPTTASCTESAAPSPNREWGHVIDRSKWQRAGSFAGCGQVKRR